VCCQAKRVQRPQPGQRRHTNVVFQTTSLNFIFELLKIRYDPRNIVNWSDFLIFILAPWRSNYSSAGRLEAEHSLPFLPCSAAEPLAAEMLTRRLQIKRCDLLPTLLWEECLSRRLSAELAAYLLSIGKLVFATGLQVDICKRPAKTRSILILSRSFADQQ
jgi:hypothetical protein